MKMYPQKCELIVVGLLIIQISCSRPDEIHFAIVPLPRDEPRSMITGMSEDMQGHLWLSLHSCGLLKYDGRKFQSYHHERYDSNSISSDFAECVFADNKGIIWIGTYSGLDRLDPVTGKIIHYRHQPRNPLSIANDTITALLKDHEGILWIGTYHGLDKLDSKTGIFVHYPHQANNWRSLSNNQVRAIYEDGQGTLWIGCGSPFLGETPKSEGGLNKLDKKTGHFTRYLHNDKDQYSLTDNRVRAIFEDSKGVLWIGTAGDGLHTMNRTAGTFQRHSYNPLHPEKLSRPALNDKLKYSVDQITFIIEDSIGQILIGTLGNGLNIYDSGTQKITHYGAVGAEDKTGLREEGLWCACKTRDGSIWISSVDRNGIGDLYKINTSQ